VAAFRSSGFEQVELTHRFDCFVGTTKERTARRYGVVGVNLSAIRSAASGRERT
jgi:hypothetical protein